MPARLVSLLLQMMCALSLFVMPASAAVADEVQTSWRLLDYIAVDYREAVRGGRVVNPAEYQEMVEFSAAVAKRLATLPAHESRNGLMAESAALQSSIAAKAEPAVIAAAARNLAAGLLTAYPVPLAPARTPDLARGAALYADNCASCHGGKGEGPSAAFAQLDPPPIAFKDRARARESSPFAI